MFPVGKGWMNLPSLEQLYSFIRFEKADIEIIEYWEKQYRIKAIGLMALIQKEYHLENKVE
jgi:hypothetical protein